MSILIPIVSEFQGKGFKDAQKQTSALDKGLKRLAVTLGTALSVRKITQFSKASVKAFIEEDKAVRALATNLENLGLAYDVKPIEDYIRTLQYATGVADGVLRPSLNKLVTSTTNLAEAQRILELGLDISAATGLQLTSVTDALARAYLGNNASLSRLNIGIQRADLNSKSFAEITDELTQKFRGQAARAANTYAGQLAILSAAAGDAQEILGEKLVKSVELLLDTDKGVPALAKSFEDVATYVGNVALGLSTILALYKQLPGTGKSSGTGFAKGLLQTLFPALKGLDLLESLGGKATTKELEKQAMIARAIAKEQGMLRSRNLKTEKKITEEVSKQEKLKKAGKAFDDELISLEAALKNAELSENEVLRLKLKKALVLENADQAEKLAKKLQDSQNELAKLAAFKPADPFSTWLDSLNKITDQLGKIGVQVAPSTPGGAPIVQAPVVPPSIVPGQGGFIPPSISQQDLNEAFGAGSGVMAPTVNINVTGTGDLSDDTKKKIVDTIIDYSSIGYSTSGWYRTTGNVAV